MDRTDSLMRLEIIEGFTAMHAAVQGFAGGRAEMTDRASVVRSAQRARHHHIARAPGNTRNVDGFFPGWRNTVALQGLARSEEHTSELQSLMRISYAVFCLKKKKTYKRLHKTKKKHI